MALGALEAITAAGKAGQIKVVGSDANIDAVKSISAGKLDATTDKRWYDLGYQGVTNLVKSIEGDKVEDTVLEPVRVDSTNIEDYLKLYDLK
jgi:ABC-type sugar transport system substrate-binding protein